MKADRIELVDGRVVFIRCVSLSKNEYAGVCVRCDSNKVKVGKEVHIPQQSVRMITCEVEIGEVSK